MNTAILVLLLNCIFFVDLMILLRNPFWTSSKRERIYLLFIILTQVLFLPYIFKVSFDSTDWSSKIGSTIKEDPVLLLIEKFCLAIMLSITVLAAFIGLWQLHKPGVSKQLKQKVWCRHMVYLIIYLQMSLNRTIQVFSNGTDLKIKLDI